MVITFDHLMTSQYRRRPYEPYWTCSAEILPGQEHTFEMPGYERALENTFFGWVLFPRTVLYEDGSTRQPKDENACFQVYWRDNDRPQPDVLPPLQVELNED